MEGFEVPLAAWRVHGTAAELYGRAGNDAASESHRALARATILRLSNSLASDDPLRDTFLSAPSARRIVDPTNSPAWMAHRRSAVSRLAAATS